MPVPAELRAAAAELLGGAGLLPDEPETAWRQVHALARRWHPQLVTSDLSDEIQQTLQDLGGMRRVALCSDDDLPFLRKAFVERYAVYRRRRIHNDPQLMAQSLPTPIRPLPDNLREMPLADVRFPETP